LDSLTPAASPRLEALIENVPGNVYRRVRTPDGRYRFAFLSSGLFRHFGVDHERLLAEPSLRFDWIHPEDRERFEADLALSAATLSLLDHRVRVVGEDGSVHWARGIARPERWPDGSIVWDGIVIDVTREIEAEAALRIAKEDAERAHQRTTGMVTDVATRLRGPIDELRALVALQNTETAIGAAITQSLTACLEALSMIGSGGALAAANVRDAAQTRRVEALGVATLTARQLEVMRLLCDSCSNKEIALRLGISPGTVRLHVAAVLKGLRLRNRRELLGAAAKRRVERTGASPIDPPPATSAAG
jgi:PAS domain S-box-containing protein